MVPKLTLSLMTSDTTEFRHHHITQPAVTPEDRVTNGLQQLVAALQGGASSRSSEQLSAIQLLQDTLTSWSGSDSPSEPPVPQKEAGTNWDKRWNDRVRESTPTTAPTVPTPPAPRVSEQPAPRVQATASPRNTQPVAHHNTQPVAHRTRSAHAQAPSPAPTMPPLLPSNPWRSKRAPTLP